MLVVPARIVLPLAAICAVIVGRPIAAADATHAVVPGYERLFADPQSELAAAGRLLAQELNCTSCHRLDKDAEKALLPKKAPVLTQIGNRVRPEYLRTMLADPQGFKHGTTMPDLLAGLTAADKAAHVEALVHYLAATGAVLDRIPDKSAAGRGSRLFEQIGCVACHGSLKSKSALVTSVPLGDLAAKYTVDSLAEFLKNPLAVRPSGRMPSLNLKEEEARDIAHSFLKGVEVTPNMNYRYYEGRWDKLPDFALIEPKATGTSAGFDIGVAKRRDKIGLQFEGFFLVAKDGQHKFSLASDDGSRLWIDGELVADCDGIHPMQTEHGKARLFVGVHSFRVDWFNDGGEQDLKVEIEPPGQGRQDLGSIAVLTREAAGATKQRFAVDPALVERGRQLFTGVGCASCHEMRDGDKLLASTAKAKPWDALEAGRGCLSETPEPSTPRFALTARQRQALDAALPLLAADKPEPLAGKPLISHTLATFNCIACHARDGLGGIEPERNEWFTTTVKEMGDEGRIPPPLTGVGGKLTLDWLKKVLSQGSKDRPYMHTRMPKFDLKHAAQLADAMAALDTLADVRLPAFDVPEHRVKSEGRFLVGGKAFSCVKCHTFGKFKAEGIQAIDMTIMGSRLREEWFVRYVRDPPTYRPGTRMPAAWPKTGKSMLPSVLYGDSDKQIAAVWHYLSDREKAAVPFGVMGNTPIELAPSTEPILYRNFIQGAGPRAIGVGFVEKTNYAWDANQMRLALVWHGAFIDAATHWNGRGQGFQPPLGDHVLELPAGVPLARLDSEAKSPWPSGKGKELGYQFLGYRLGEGRRPVFRYRWDAIEVEDESRPAPGETAKSLVRVLTLVKPAGDEEGEAMWFRAAVGRNIEAQADGWYSVDKVVRMKLDAGDAAAVVRQQGDQKELLVPIQFHTDRAAITQTLDW